MTKKLYKSRTNIKLDGVCAGLADFFDKDPTLIRIAWLLLLLAGAGTPFILYIICAIIIPREPEDGYLEQ